jgi:hypothetical protein
MTTPSCLECKYHRHEDNREICYGVRQPYVVTRGPKDAVTCSVMRGNANGCGKDGAWFERGPALVHP